MMRLFNKNKSSTSSRLGDGHVTIVTIVTLDLRRRGGLYQIGKQTKKPQTSLTSVIILIAMYIVTVIVICIVTKACD